MQREYVRSCRAEHIIPDVGGIGYHRLEQPADGNMKVAHEIVHYITAVLRESATLSFLPEQSSGIHHSSSDSFEPTPRYKLALTYTPIQHFQEKPLRRTS